MASSTAPRYFSCENGHAQMEGSTVCGLCGAQMTNRRARAPKAAPAPRTDAETAPEDVDDAGEATTATTRRASLVIVATSIALAVAGATVAVLVAQAPENSASDSCDGLAQAELAIDGVLEHAPETVCFVVTDDAALYVGAISASDVDLTLEIRTSDGVFWVAANDTVGTGPAVVADFVPGTYVATIAALDGRSTGDFSVFIASNGGPGYDPTLPTEDACGTQVAPILQASGLATLDSIAADFACLVVPEEEYVKIGLAADPGNAADLSLAIHAFEGGRAAFLRSVDDTIALDPEMSLTLEAGTYLLEVSTWDGTPVGTYTLYADTTRSFFRTFEPSSRVAGLAMADCSGALPVVDIDGTVALPDETVGACLTLPDVRRLHLSAESGADQDLTLEVVGFDTAGSPIDYAWVDDDLWATSPDDLDPRLDVVLPAGTYVLAVGEYSGATPTAVTVAVDDLDR